MIRPQRRVHSVVWPLIGAILALGIAAGLWARGKGLASGAGTAGTTVGARP